MRITLQQIEQNSAMTDKQRRIVINIENYVKPNMKMPTNKYEAILYIKKNMSAYIDEVRRYKSTAHIRNYHNVSCYGGRYNIYYPDDCFSMYVGNEFLY